MSDTDLTMEEIDADLDFMQERINDVCPSCKEKKASSGRFAHSWRCIRQQAKFLIRGELTWSAEENMLRFTYNGDVNAFVCGKHDYEYLMEIGKRYGNKFEAVPNWT